MPSGYADQMVYHFDREKYAVNIYIKTIGKIRNYARQSGVYDYPNQGKRHFSQTSPLK